MKKSILITTVIIMILAASCGDPASKKGTTKMEESTEMEESIVLPEPETIEQSGDTLKVNKTCLITVHKTVDDGWGTVWDNTLDRMKENFAALGIENVTAETKYLSYKLNNGEKVTIEVETIDPWYPLVYKKGYAPIPASINEMELYKAVRFLGDEIKNPTEKCIFIKYKQPINGYKVEVAFTPQYKQYLYGKCRKIIGKAVLTFKHQSGGQENKIASLTFTVPCEFLHDFDGNEELRSFAKGQTYHIDYDFVGIPGVMDKEWIAAQPLFHGELPFLFKDVTFDGKDELILTDHDRGTYNVYSITSDGKFDDAIGQQPPFNELDDNSDIDSKNKQIIIYYTSRETGERGSIRGVYQLDENGKFYKNE